MNRTRSKNNSNRRKAKHKALFLICCGLAVIAIVAYAAVKFREENSSVTIIKIISPTNCRYDLKIDGSDLSVSGISETFVMMDSINHKSRLDVYSIDTTLAEPALTNFLAVAEAFRIMKPEISSTRARDTYLYEVYSDGVLKKRIYGHDDQIFSAIKILRPYIKNEKIQCCEFFLLFDMVKDRQ